jgi:hypothetical protein
MNLNEIALRIAVQVYEGQPDQVRARVPPAFAQSGASLLLAPGNVES